MILRNFRLAVTLFAALVAFTPTVAAQSAADTLAVVGHAPPPVANVTATVIGTGGFSTYYYWVVAHYGGGMVFPTGPAMAGNAAAAIAAPTSISVNWTPVNGLNVTYDVLRTTTVQFPQTGYCTCRVAVGLTGTSFVDTVTTPVLYTNTGFPYQNTIGVVYENVRDYSPPQLQFSTTAGTVSWASLVTFLAGVDVSGVNLAVDVGDIVVALGNIAVTAGNISAGRTVTGGTGVTATTGNIAATTGNVLSGSYGSESLTNGGAMANPSWTVTGDFALGGGNATYTDSTHTGTLTQSAANQATPAVANAYYRFQYTVVSNTMTNGIVSVTSAYASATKVLDMTVGTGKIAYFQASATPTNFVISVSGSNGGAFVLSNLSLKQQLGGEVTGSKLNGVSGGLGLRVDSAGNLHSGGVFVNYNGLPTVGMGLSAVRAKYSVTGATTSISTFDLLPSAAAGFYNVKAYAQVTTQSTGACTLTVTTGWTYNSQTETANTINTLSLASNNVSGAGTSPFQIDASTNITLATTVAGASCNNRVWDLYVVLEQIN